MIDRGNTFCIGEVRKEKNNEFLVIIKQDIVSMSEAMRQLSEIAQITHNVQYVVLEARAALMICPKTQWRFD